MRFFMLSIFLLAVIACTTPAHAHNCLTCDTVTNATCVNANQSPTGNGSLTRYFTCVTPPCQLWLTNVIGSTVDYTITTADTFSIDFEGNSDSYTEQQVGAGLYRYKWTGASYVCMTFQRSGIVAETVMTCRNTIGSCQLQWLYLGGNETVSRPPPVAPPVSPNKYWFVKLTDDQQGCSASTFSEVIVYNTDVCVRTSTGSYRYDCSDVNNPKQLTFSDANCTTRLSSFNEGYLCRSFDSSIGGRALCTMNYKQYLLPSAPGRAKYPSGATCGTDQDGWAELLIRNPKCVFSGGGSDYLIQMCDGKDYINKRCSSGCSSCSETRSPRAEPCRQDETNELMMVHEKFCYEPNSGAASVQAKALSVTFALFVAFAALNLFA